MTQADYIICYVWDAIWASIVIGYFVFLFIQIKTQPFGDEKVR
jgi:hypothetical protein